MTLVAIRHAPVAARGLCYGRLDLPAEAISDRQRCRVLASLPEVRTIRSSPSRRCLDLAEAIGEYRRLAVCTDRRLMELSFGQWEGRAWAELEPLDAFQAWMRDWMTVAPPGGETLLELMARVRSLVLDATPGTVFVTHAGVIRALRVLLEKCSWDEAIVAEVGHLQPRVFSCEPLGTRQGR